jgi:hypothetical protein
MMTGHSRKTSFILLVGLLVAHVSSTPLLSFLEHQHEEEAAGPLNSLSEQLEQVMNAFHLFLC